MSHPAHHAQSSVRKFGGNIQDYFPIHHWFDETKICYAHFFHRALRHHTEGIKMAEKKFKNNIINSDNKSVSVLQIGQQHIIEDCTFIPSPDDWLKATKKQSIPIKNKESVTEYLIKYLSIKTTEDIQILLTLVDWFYEPSQWTDHSLWPVFRAHSQGIFTAEDVFGVFINFSHKNIPTRIIAEKIVEQQVGTIITPCHWLKKLSTDKWMLKTEKLKVN